MFCNKSFCVLYVALMFSSTAFSVTEENVWVPKGYTAAKHKLLSTAVEAEKTERCVRAVYGEINVEKTTAEAYYFVVTCRDVNQVSYNLSYLYPVNGAMPTLINEQLVVVEVEEVEEVDESPTITGNVAWPLCINELKAQTRTMLGVVVEEENSTLSEQGLELQTFDIPFDAKNPDDELLRYSANCIVDIDRKVSIKISPR